MPSKRSVLDLFSREELLDFAIHFGVGAADRRGKDHLVDALNASQAVNIGELLDLLPARHLRELCDTLGLGTGRAKADLIGLLTGTRRPASAQPPRRRGSGRGSGSRSDESHHQSFSTLTSLISSVGDLLRGDFRRSDYGRVILPFVVLRRFDCVLAPTEGKVLAKGETLKHEPSTNLDPVLKRITGVGVYNTSRFDFERLQANPVRIADNLTDYVRGFSGTARDVLDRFKFLDQVAKLDAAGLLHPVVSRFAAVDLHPERVPNVLMGRIFEELIRRYSEGSGETAGEHFTPTEVTRLMANLLLVEDGGALRRRGIVRSLYDPAAGTGGMLTGAVECLQELNPDARLAVYGQELNDESFVICRADMMLKGQDPENILPGNSLSNDGHAGSKFDYLLSNPPFGVDWRKVERSVRDEHERLGFSGRFGPGLPRVSDGSLLFLLHMLAKMKPANAGEPGSRIGIVLSSSAMQAGDAGSGESEIRRWVIENDLLEAIVSLPSNLFHNTTLNVYVWILTNRKPPHRRGKIQLINGTTRFRRMSRGIGHKRHEMTNDDIAELSRVFHDFKPGKLSRIFDNEDFGFCRVVVERPLRLSFQASPERIERVRETLAVLARGNSNRKATARRRGPRVGKALHAAILGAVESLDGDRVYRNRGTFERDLDRAFEARRAAVPVPLRRMILAALSERDEGADICVDAEGNPEAAPDLRDFENIPLAEDIEAYFEREIRPHVPDAWIDETKTRIGYEIPFVRHFHEGTTYRPLSVIEGEIRRSEREIQKLLAKVLP